MNKVLTFFLAFAVISVVSSCSQDADLDDQKQEILQYIADENLTATEIEGTPGLYYAITNQGTGIDYPTESSDVTVHYEGRLLDGTKFDSSYDRGQPLEINLGSVITGWRKAIPKFRKGDEGRIMIPSAYGYGANGSGTIPGNAILVFNIELIDFD